NQILLQSMPGGTNLRRLRGHENGVACLAFSPDGRTLASGSWDHTIRLWHVKLGLEKDVLKGHTDYVEAVVFSPDGKTLASGSKDGTLRIWDVAKAHELRHWNSPQGRTWSLAFGRDGKTLFAGGDMGDSGDPTRSLIVWSPEGKELRRLGGHSLSRPPRGESDFRTLIKGVGCVALSPDRRTLASGGADGRILLRDPATGKETLPEMGHRAAVSGV